jgi:hypothetical protein
MNQATTAVIVAASNGPKSGGPAIWMGFMMIVLVIWGVWINQDEELRHQRSEDRARVALLVVIGIGVVSLGIVFALTAS